MERGERTCVVCGKEYIYCPNCKKGNPTETWRFMYDSEECRNIFKICSNFAFGHINAETAKKKLEKYNITDRSKYNDDIRRNLSAIYAAKAETPEEEEKNETEADANFRSGKNRRKATK